MLRFVGKHKTFSLALLIFVVLLWLITAQVKSGRFLFLEKPVLAVSGFFERTIGGAFNAVGSVWTRYAFLTSTQRENLRLTEELNNLRVENQLTNELLAENERLRAVLNFKKLYPPSAIVVQVIGKTVSPASSTVTISKGSENGIEKGLAVITAAGIVGRVQTVLPGTAKVILLTDPESTLAVRVQRNREDGLLEGKLSHCALKYVSYYADVQEGDLLVTSGLDGIYPKGLPVAMVVKVRKHEASPFQSVVAEPIVRFSKLEEALVLKK